MDLFSNAVQFVWDWLPKFAFVDNGLKCSFNMQHLYIFAGLVLLPFAKMFLKMSFKMLFLTFSFFKNRKDTKINSMFPGEWATLYRDIKKYRQPRIQNLIVDRFVSNSRTDLISLDNFYKIAKLIKNDSDLLKLGAIFNQSQNQEKTSELPASWLQMTSKLTKLGTLGYARVRNYGVISNFHSHNKGVKIPRQYVESILSSFGDLISSDMVNILQSHIA